MADRHLIVSQVLDLKINSLNWDDQDEQLVSEAFLVHGAPVIEDVLDSIASTDTVIRLGRVIVDLGHIEKGALVDTFGIEMANPLRDAIEDLMRSDSVLGELGSESYISTDAPLARSTVENIASESETSESRGLLHETGKSVDTSDAGFTNDRELVEFALYSIEFGLRPWWSHSRFSGDSKATANAGEQLPVLYQSSQSFQTELIRAYTRRPLEVVLRLVSEAWLRPLGICIVTGKLVPQAICTADSADNPLNAATLEAALGREASRRLAVAIVPATQTRQSPERRLADLCPSSGEAPRESENGGKSRRDDVLSGRTQGPAVNSSSNHFASVRSQEIQEESQDRPSERDAFFVSNAGVVLLQPFIPLLFDELDLTSGNKFRDTPARVRAIRLLEYLVWGTTDRPEFSLQFEKILCDFPMYKPILAVDMTKDELNEASSVLNSVVKHWSVLKNTSVDGLRATFLQRDAKFVFGEDQDRLVVERQSTDVLLSSIPWAFGVMRLPWMTRSIAIEW